MEHTHFCAKSAKNDLKPPEFLKCNFYFETEGVLNTGGIQFPASSWLLWTITDWMGDLGGRPMGIEALHIAIFLVKWSLTFDSNPSNIGSYTFTTEFVNMLQKRNSIKPSQTLAFTIFSTSKPIVTLSKAIPSQTPTLGKTISIYILHNIIQIHNNVMWDWHYSIEFSHIQYEYEKYSIDYYQSCKTMLWIWITLCCSPNNGVQNICRLIFYCL